MTTFAGLVFFAQAIRRESVAGKRVLEVGSRDSKGCVRRLLSSYGPSKYVGVDLQPGDNVDYVCDSGNLLSMFGRDRVRGLDGSHGAHQGVEANGQQHEGGLLCRGANRNHHALFGVPILRFPKRLLEVRAFRHEGDILRLPN